MSLTKVSYSMIQGAPINLVDYGAVGDGSTDDTVAIQNAINALGAQESGRLTCPNGASYKITDTIDFTILGNVTRYYELDFAGAEFTWYGSDSGSDPMFYFYENKGLTVKNFTLLCNSVVATSATVKGIKIDSLQPDGADALVFSDFRIRLANICIDLGSVGANQNRVSDCRFEHFLLEGSSVGVQTNSTNCDSMLFTQGVLSGCDYGFNFVRAGFNEINSCIGYACDPFIRVAGPIGPLTVISCQSEEGGLTNPTFLYRQIYTGAATGTISLHSCNIDNKIWLDYSSGIGSSTQTLNIYGGYFREMAVDAPDSTINLYGTEQTPGYTMTIAGTNSRCFNYGSRIQGTLIDTANGYRPVSSIDTSFTPTIIGTSSAGTATYSDQVGSYTRFADLCYFQIHLVWTGGTGTGNLQIAGLPFTSANNATKAYGTAINGYTSNVSLSAGNYLTAFVPSSATVLSLVQNPTGGGAVAPVPYDAAGEILISGWYKVA